VTLKAGIKFLTVIFLQILHLPLSRIKANFWTKKNPNLYFGSIDRNQIQRIEGGFIGLSLKPSHFSEIRCDISRASLPFASNSIDKVQAEDVFEHIQLDSLPKVCDEIFRVLKKGSVFRLSVPDYNSIVLKRRSIYDYKGRVIADPLTGSSVYYDFRSEKTLTRHGTDGNSHLWFPTKDLLDNLIQNSDLRHCDSIKFWHYNLPEGDFTLEVFPELCMPVFRCPPKDMRADGLPISIVVDFIK
jgi:SAM-dependent methyltransferase